MNLIKQLLFRILPSDFLAKKYPVSLKGIVFVNDKIVLLKNERNEWELPGGKIELNETAEECTVREIREELNLTTEVYSIIDVWMYNILGKINVLIVTYLCNPLIIDEKQIRFSHEHKEVDLFKVEEINGLKMPQGYKNSIFKALKILKND